MANAVVYFPYIRVPDSEWFTRVLLYWDKVGTIVPAEYSQDPEFLGVHTAGLIRHRLVEPLRPDGDIREARDGYLDSFLALVDNDPLIDRELPFEQRRTHRVHGDKSGTRLAKALDSRGLARRAAGPDWASWWEIDRRAADLLMGYLAGVIGSTERYGMDPITDSEEALSIFLTIPAEKRGIVAETEPVRQVMLEGLLPAPADGIPPEELVAFRKAHGDRLTAFRVEIERRVLSTASLPDERFRAERARLDRQELEPELQEIVRRMSERGWRRIGLGTLAAVGTGIALADASLTGGALGQAGASLGLGGAITGAFGPARAREKLRKHPLAWAALAQRELVT